MKLTGNGGGIKINIVVKQEIIGMQVEFVGNQADITGQIGNTGLFQFLVPDKGIGYEAAIQKSRFQQFIGCSCSDTDVFFLSVDHEFNITGEPVIGGLVARKVIAAIHIKFQCIGKDP